MNTVKDILEIIYYVAFIIMTWLIVIYARKTYIFQSSKGSQLLCKVCIEKETLGDFEFRYALEIYNYGNDVAKQIDVIVEDRKVTVVDFIKPNESYLYPLGVVGQMISCNRVWPNVGEEIQEGTPIRVQLIVSESIYTFEINTDLLFAYRGVATGTLRDVSKEIGKTTDKVEVLSEKLDKVADRIDVASRKNTDSIGRIAKIFNKESH